MLQFEQFATSRKEVTVADRIVGLAEGLGLSVVELEQALDSGQASLDDFDALLERLDGTFPTRRDVHNWLRAQIEGSTPINCLDLLRVGDVAAVDAELEIMDSNTY